LLLEFDRYTNLIEENYSSSESLGNNEIKLVDYEIPMNEIYIYKPNESKYYTRWCVYVSDYTKNENLSFQNCTKFWFRPYFALFTDSNLSDAEQKSDFTLFINFLTSSLASNIIFLLITFSVVFYLKKKRFKSKKK